ncbi:synaptotagmin-7-like isoform X2 [Liolophura sinensis]|uniref:synaptotagmin-7-like isoform X2 n=1 Tax=Liolophura sinensis TaxID=3198878 RepID=UPI0031596B49
MEDVGEVVLVVTGSLAGLILLIMAAFLCACCWKRKYKDNEDKGQLYSPVDEGYHNQNRLSVDSGSSTASRSRGQSPAITRKTIRFERPEKRLVTEHVQPSVSTHTSLNQSLGMSPDQYHSLGETQSLHSVDMKSESGKGLWKDVQKFTAMFLEEGAAGEGPVEENLVEGVDFKLGKLQFCIGYDFPTSTLTIKILRAMELPAKDFSGTSDPYVRVMLMPDKKHKFTTKIKKKNLNPRWNETFAYEGWPHNKLLEKTLYLQVVDYDRFSRDDPIGELYIPLNEIDLSIFPTVWKYLQPCKDSRGRLGELLVSLCYQPTIGRLTMVIMKAKDLKAKDLIGTSDPYVKMWQFFGNKRTVKRKTAVHFGTLNPVFNETFIFDIPWEKIRDCSIEITVMDYDRVGRNDLIGKFTLGPRSGPMETRHWNDMLSKPRQPVAQWHMLKD